jgi:hypothetical protein
MSETNQLRANLIIAVESEQWDSVAQLAARLRELTGEEPASTHGIRERDRGPGGFGGSDCEALP